MFLEDPDLFKLTKRKTNRARRKVLMAMGIQHKVRPDGSLAVLCKHVEELFGVSGAALQSIAGIEPDWSKV